MRSEIKLSEQTAAQARNGIEKPRGQRLYKTLAARRLDVKKNYLKEKINGTADIGEFLSTMGHNIIASMLCGKSNEVKKTHYGEIGSKLRKGLEKYLKMS